MNKSDLMNSIFYPRKSHKAQDEKDLIINTPDNEKIGSRFFLKDKSFHTIIFFHGNAELDQE